MELFIFLFFVVAESNHCSKLSTNCIPQISCTKQLYHTYIKYSAVFLCYILIHLIILVCFVSIFYIPMLLSVWYCFVYACLTKNICSVLIVRHQNVSHTWCVCITIICVQWLMHRHRDIHIDSPHKLVRCSCMTWQKT